MHPFSLSKQVTIFGLAAAIFGLASCKKPNADSKAKNLRIAEEQVKELTKMRMDLLKIEKVIFGAKVDGVAYGAECEEKTLAETIAQLCEEIETAEEPGDENLCREIKHRYESRCKRMKFFRTYATNLKNTPSNRWYAAQQYALHVFAAKNKGWEAEIEEALKAFAPTKPTPVYVKEGGATTFSRKTVNLYCATFQECSTMLHYLQGFAQYAPSSTIRILDFMERHIPETLAGTSSQMILAHRIEVMSLFAKLYRAVDLREGRLPELKPKSTYRSITAALEHFKSEFSLLENLISDDLNLFLGATGASTAQGQELTVDVLGSLADHIIADIETVELDGFTRQALDSGTTADGTPLTKEEKAQLQKIAGAGQKIQRKDLPAFLEKQLKNSTYDLITGMYKTYHATTAQQLYIDRLLIMSQDRSFDLSKWAGKIEAAVADKTFGAMETMDLLVTKASFEASLPSRDQWQELAEKISATLGGRLETKLQSAKEDQSKGGGAQEEDSQEKSQALEGERAGFEFYLQSITLVMNRIRKGLEESLINMTNSTIGKLAVKMERKISDNALKTSKGSATPSALISLSEFLTETLEHRSRFEKILSDVKTQRYVKKFGFNRYVPELNNLIAKTNALQILMACKTLESTAQPGHLPAFGSQEVQSLLSGERFEVGKYCRPWYVQTRRSVPLRAFLEEQMAAHEQDRVIDQERLNMFIQFASIATIVPVAKAANVMTALTVRGLSGKVATKLSNMPSVIRLGAARFGPPIMRFAGRTGQMLLMSFYFGVFSAASTDLLTFAYDKFMHGKIDKHNPYKDAFWGPFGNRYLSGIIHGYFTMQFLGLVTRRSQAFFNSPRWGHTVPYLNRSSIGRGTVGFLQRHPVGLHKTLGIATQWATFGSIPYLEDRFYKLYKAELEGVPVFAGDKEAKLHWLTSLATATAFSTFTRFIHGIPAGAAGPAPGLVKPPSKMEVFKNNFPGSNPFRLLGVSKGAPKSQITAAYKGALKSFNLPGKIAELNGRFPQRKDRGDAYLKEFKEMHEKKIELSLAYRALTGK